MLLSNFSKYLMPKKYSFSGRNSTVPISQATIEESLNKIIITTNIYPTQSVLDELINSSTNNLNSNFQLNLYKESYVFYDKVGISQDNDKNKLVNNSKKNLNFYYTKANVVYSNNSQDKAGLYNPCFQDIAQYGIQGTLMYLFVPDDNFKNWFNFFKNKNNLDPVLKEESLRDVTEQTPVIKTPDPMIGLQAPQKYCLINKTIPGLVPETLSTYKSNITNGQTNSTC
jgi:hypothetical protein